MKKYIKNAEEPMSKEDQLKDAIIQLKDDFDFAISGIEKLAADGDVDRALELVSTTSAMINGAIEEILENSTSEEE